MVTEAAESRFKALMNALKIRLKPLGYVKQRQRFRCKINENVALIEVQRSLNSDDGTIRLSVNLGVISTKLSDAEVDAKKVGSDRAHLRVRLGFFLSDPHDKWWELGGGECDSAISDEIVDLISRKALPFLAEHASDESLANLWKTGRSPGLTERQRARLLAQLQTPA